MKEILSILLAGLVLAGFSQSDKDLADAAINQNLIRSHIGFLASDELGGRATPSAGQTVAAKYIESRFREYGVEMTPGMDSYYQPVPMKKVKAAQVGKLVFGDKQLNINEQFIYFEGSSTIEEVEVVYVEYGAEKDLKKRKVEGKLVVSLCGDGKSESPQEWFSLAKGKADLVKKRGGIGLVELYNSTQLPWTILTKYFGGDAVVLDREKEEEAFFRAWVNRSAIDNDWLESKKLKASLNIEKGEEQAFTVYNLIGTVKGTDPKLSKEYVVYSAHYDHIGISEAVEGDSINNGSRDNAVGTVTVLAAAQNIAKYPTKRSALFILFTGEEKGLLGSEHYVDHSPIALNKIVYCFNSDNGGYNDTSLATIFGLERTSAKELIVEACDSFGLKAIEDPAPEQGLFDRSDNVNFAKKGIPAPTFSMGFTAFDEEILKYYHQVTDNPETLDYSYLEKFFKAYVYTARRIGNADEAPFWTKGDKYYEKGVSLYGKE